jgi:hypothetical protein
MSGGRAYAVAEEGSIWEWNGTAWSSMAANGRTEGQRLRAIHGAGNVAFIMGDRVFKGRR